MSVGERLFDNNGRKTARPVLERQWVGISTCHTVVVSPESVKSSVNTIRKDYQIRVYLKGASEEFNYYVSAGS